MKSNKTYAVCRRCSYHTEVNAKLFAKILGSTVVGFGGYAWISFLFAGTGLAFVICAAIVAGGVGILAYSDEITKWLCSRYGCPRCNSRDWELLSGEALQKRIEEHKKSNELENSLKAVYNEYGDLNKRNKEMEESIKNMIPKQNHYTNEQVRPAFIRILKSARTELDMTIPWFGEYKKSGKLKSSGFDNEVMNIIENLLRNEVKVKILWGFGDSTDSKRKFSSDFINLLKERYERFGKLFATREGDTHEKIILCNDDCFVSGSYNFGSFGGDYRCNTRDESMTISYDASVVSMRREESFNF